ncbi:tyrosine-type recombinase/integrase [Aestuariicella hydrocarbonica]|uniref:Tyrosine-type recombinase/integrase n=2 Tax=Pseudomaricurvus hydrocarbonicus TaxID=1470433 RepID=A0A9E5MGK0_9GAMM|nr:tyrosine-type recombinase/integrase [Aestuariicella hydrocarbonica]
MARTVKPLSNTQIHQAKPQDKEYNLPDGDGLALRIKPSGSKLWLFNYLRPYTKRRTNMGFGAYPEVSLADARRRRADARVLLAQDIDPKEHRDAQIKLQLEANELTFERVINQWFEIKKASITPGHAEDVIRSLNKHVIPQIGKVPVHKITAPMVIETLRLLAGSGKLEAVKRVCQRLNEIMVYGVNTGVVPNNPLTGIRHAFQSPKAVNNPTLKPKELPQLLKTLQRANIRPITCYLIQWQLHTMTRPGEASGARWDEIDQEQAVWVIPAERMKKRREHAVPLTPQVNEILKALEPLSGKSPFLFPSDIDPRKHANASTANVALKRMGFHGRLTAHGMRSLASTTLNEEGFDPDVIEAALAHVDKNSVRAAYNRTDYLKRRRTLMEWWSTHIDCSWSVRHPTPLTTGSLGERRNGGHVSQHFGG